jgi:DNA-directed RNA polymerase II subunit RPB11
MAHPLEHEFDLKIQTTPDTSPIQVLQNEINFLISELGSLKRDFEVIFCNVEPAYIACH